ncbi:MAG: peptidoglycan DD-metalloendopeptidase family protein [Solirubrobacteraceae bacterium]
MTIKRGVSAVLGTAAAWLVLVAVAAVPVASAEPCAVAVTLVGGAVKTIPVDATPGVIPNLNLSGVVSETMTCTTPATSSSSTSTTTTTTTTTTSSSPSSSSSSSTTTSSSTSTSPSHSKAPTRRRTTPSTSTQTTPRPTSSSPEKSSSHRQTPSRSAKPRAKKHKSKTKHKSKNKHKSNNKHKSKSTSPQRPSAKGVPKTSNPTFSLSLPGPAPIGVPNFFIDSFRIPPFLIPIYQAAGIEYQVPWQVLAGINEIETDYGRNLSVSSADAVGWMQFLPSTWRQWGVDANGDGVADPYNPVDAIFTAARYLHAAGASKNLPRAIFAYNHAGWYVQSVLLRAKLIGGLPDKLLGALTGLVQGHFPVAAPAKYADDSVERLATRRVKKSNAAIPVDSKPGSKGVSIFAHQGAPVIAVNDGRVVKVGQNAALGHYLELQDQTGNIYTYAQLGSIPKQYPVPKPVKISAADIAKQLSVPKVASPSAPASAGAQTRSAPPSSKQATKALTPATKRGAITLPSTAAGAGSPAPSAPSPAAAAPSAVKERLFADPSRPASYAAGGQLQLQGTTAQISSFQNYFSDVLHLSKDQYTLSPLKAGAIVVAGTILGRLGAPSQTTASHLLFMVRPAGKNAPKIDPKPVLDGWKLLEATAVYRARGVNPFFGPGAKNPSVGQVLLESKEQLTNRILVDPHVKIYTCGRRDIQAGVIDRRVLASIEFLSASGLDPTVSGLECGHSLAASSGTDAAGATGSSVDIAKINGIPILGHQGSGSITDITIRRLLTLQGGLKPDQIISLMSFKGQHGTLALPDHTNRIQVVYTPLFGQNKVLSAEIKAILRPGQWVQLISRIGKIPEPTVPTAPSKYAIRTGSGG